MPNHLHLVAASSPSPQRDIAQQPAGEARPVANLNIVPEPIVYVDVRYQPEPDDDLWLLPVVVGAAVFLLGLGFWVGGLFEGLLS